MSVCCSACSVAGIGLGQPGFVVVQDSADVALLSLAAEIGEGYAVDDNVSKIRESHRSFLSCEALAASAAQVEVGSGVPTASKWRATSLASTA